MGGGGLVNFGGGLRFFGLPFRKGLNFLGSHLGEGYNFWAPLGDVRVLLNGFCATEILSTV